MKLATVIVFLWLIGLQVVVSMESNIISDNDLQEENANNANNVTAPNVENNNQGLVLQQPKSQSKKIAETTTWVFKYALVHPFSFFITGCADTYFIFKDQAPLGVWVLMQYLTLVTRFTWPNLGICKKINHLAIQCRISTPVMEEATISTNTINLPLMDDEENIAGNINTNGTANAQQPKKKKEGACERNCAIIFGHFLMNEYSFLLTALLAFIFTYDDSIVFALWMTVQIFAYFLRTKCPNMSIGRLLNQIAFDVGVPDAEAQNMKPSPNVSGIRIHAANTLPKSFSALPESYRQRPNMQNGNVQLNPSTGNIQFNV